MDEVSWSVPGLRNLGNTCYIACALQALASSPAFLRYLNDATVYIRTAVSPFTSDLRHLLGRLQPQPAGLPALEPWEVFEALRGQIPDRLLAPGEQHDAVEALELLVDTVSNELKRHYKQESLASLFLAPSDRRHIDKAASGFLVWKTQAASPLHGYTAHETLCTVCGHSFITQATAFQSLLLPLSKDTTSHFVAQGLSLETCLSRTCSEPELVEGVACARCSLKATLRAAADAPAEAATASGRLQRIEACSAPADLSPAQDAVGDRADQPGGGPVRRRPGPLPDAEDLEALAKSAGLQWVVQRTRVARTAPISRPPKVLALHLKRGVWTNGGQFLKLSGRVSFTEQLDLLPFTSAAPNSSVLLPHVAGKQPAFKPAVNRGEGPALQATGSEPPSCLYSLAAVIVHAGHSNSGHYHLYRRIREEQLQARPGKLTKSRAVAPEGNGGTNTPSSWLSVSDQSVRPADVLEVLACEATLLLYEKQDTCEF